VDESKYSVSETGPQIEEFLDLILDDMNLDVEYEILDGAGSHPDLEDPDVLVKFSGPDVDVLLGNKAEVLLALEFLTMEALEFPGDHHSRLCFDANDYRLLRIEELRLSATTAADRVKKSGQPFHFSPMNSRERRIIHLSLRNETEIRSESTGSGPFRQVVVLPVGMPLPEPIRPPRPMPERDRRDFPGGGRGGPRGRGRSGPPRRGGGGGRRP
jgi:spoIIIJ-associated protein